MAAPAVKNVRNLSGNWDLNKDLSDSSEPLLQIQGVGYLTRKAINMGKISLNLKQYEQVPELPDAGAAKITCIDSIQTASGVKGVQETRHLDNEPREHVHRLFGTVKARTKWVKVDEIGDEFLAGDWLFEDENHELIFNHAINTQSDWEATEVWGFQMVNGERRYCSRVKVTSGKNKSAQAKLVYDYISE